MKYIQILIVCLLLTSSMSGQEDNGKYNEKRKKKRDRVEVKLETKRIGFITKELDLSSDEAQKFWPIYNEFQKKMKSLKEQNGAKRKKIDWENISDEDASQLLTDVLEREQAELDLKIRYFKQMESAIPTTKIAKLYIVEKQFKREVLDYVKKRMRGKKGEKRRAKNEK